MGKKLKVSVIMPTYNERGNIKKLAEEIIKRLRKSGYEDEIIIVDDNSPDGTGKVAKQLEKKHKSVRAILRKEKGLGTALKRGISESTGDVVAVMDCDFSHPPEIIPIMLKELNNSDAVFASRYVKGGSMNTNRLQYHLSKLFNYSIKSFLKIQVLDCTNGFFVIRKSALKGLDMDRIFRDYGEYCFNMLYFLKPKKLKIKEIPFSYMPRRYGHSKTSLVKAGIHYWFEAFKLRLGL